MWDDALMSRKKCHDGTCTPSLSCVFRDQLGFPPLMVAVMHSCPVKLRNQRDTTGIFTSQRGAEASSVRVKMSVP
jgi:hypothetical protein